MSVYDVLWAPGGSRAAALIPGHVVPHLAGGAPVKGARRGTEPRALCLHIPREQAAEGLVVAG